MTSIQIIKADTAPNEVVLLIQRREKATTEAEFNAITVEIIAALARSKFAPMPAVTPDWAKVMEELLAAIVRGEFPHPYKFDQEQGEEVLCIRTAHIMDYLSHTGWMRECWADMPIRTGRALMKQLKLDGVLLVDSDGAAQPFERTLRGLRWGHMAAIRLARLRSVGLDPIAAAQATQRMPKP